MSKQNKIFSSIPVNIPDRSGFDLSHEVLTTAQTGTVIPITHFEALPGDTIRMNGSMKVTLPPFAVPFMGRVDAELTAAFIPYRVIWNGWQSFITQNNGVSPSLQFRSREDGSSDQSLVPQMVPHLALPSVSTVMGREVGASSASQGVNNDGFGHPLLGPGSLADYLGMKISTNVAHNFVSALPFLAYQKFCDDWIIDDNITYPFFSRFNNPGIMRIASQAQTGASMARRIRSAYAHMLPFMSGHSDVNGQTSSLNQDFTLVDLDTELIGRDPVYTNSDSAYTFNRLRMLGGLRQRCFAKDYFTTATLQPQAGAESSVLFNVSGSADPSDNSVSGVGSFTIASLRAANSLQKWLERNNIAGTEYGSQILAHFGVTPPDAVLNRSVLLGRVRTPVVTSAVQNTAGATVDTASSKNPFAGQLGSAAGFGSGYDNGRLIDDFSPKEHGIVMVFFTLIPHAYYNSGIKKDLKHLSYGDFAWPEFAHIGDQPIYDYELRRTPSTDSETTIFGYQQRYSEYKFMQDIVNSHLADGNSLEVFALQRGFDYPAAPTEGYPLLTTDFLEIPMTYLDQVFAVNSAISGYACMVDAYFDTKAIRVLPEYSLPSL